MKNGLLPPFYSLLKLFTGFVSAVLRLWAQIVRRVKVNNKTGGIMKIERPGSM
jgi:hypothetical protein